MDAQLMNRSNTFQYENRVNWLGGLFQKMVALYCSICVYIWVNYNDLTTTSLEIMVSKGNHPQMALIEVSEIL